MLPLVRLQRGDLLAEVPQQPLGELDVGLPVGLAAELLGLGRVFVVVVRLKDVVVVVFVFVVFFSLTEYGGLVPPPPPLQIFDSLHILSDQLPAMRNK